MEFFVFHFPMKSASKRKRQTELQLEMVEYGLLRARIFRCSFQDIILRKIIIIINSLYKYYEMQTEYHPRSLSQYYNQRAHFLPFHHHHLLNPLSFKSAKLKINAVLRKQTMIYDHQHLFKRNIYTLLKSSAIPSHTHPKNKKTKVTRPNKRRETKLPPPPAHFKASSVYTHNTPIASIKFNDENWEVGGGGQQVSFSNTSPTKGISFIARLYFYSVKFRHAAKQRKRCVRKLLVVGVQAKHPTTPPHTPSSSLSLSLIFKKTFSLGYS